MEAKFKIYPGLVIAVFICAGVILLGIYPYRPNSLIGWAVLLLLSVPVAFMYEMLGKKFNNESIKNIGSFARVGFGVVALGLIIIASLSVLSLLEPYLGKWGS